LGAAFVASVSVILASSAVAQGLPSGFVYLREVEPTVAQDIRYAGPDNFMGQALPGYDAAECVLQEPAARALAAAQADLAAEGLGLKVYDCYRPAAAARAMMRWASADNSGDTNPRFFPNVRKGALVARGYIAAHSSHSSGFAVDLTLIAPGGSRSASGSGPCRGPADDSLDMGTSFDCFDPLSHTAAPAIGAEARRHRALLVAVMQRHGFVNYRREWWHFSYSRAGSAIGTFDFPIVARPAR
jgi:D-alanyl-D-alanine dipeptidase